MATAADCAQALRDLAAKLADVGVDQRRRHSVDRTVQCTLSDIGICYSGRVVDGELVDLVEGETPDAQIKVSVDSDDLLALVSGELALGAAWAVGRLRIDASVLDLIRLRALV